MRTMATRPVEHGSSRSELPLRKNALPHSERGIFESRLGQPTVRECAILALSWPGSSPHETRDPCALLGGPRWNTGSGRRFPTTCGVQADSSPPRMWGGRGRSAAKRQLSDMDDYPVIIYDGMCNLCNSSVDFVLRHDARGHFRFAAFQSAAGQGLIRHCPTEQPLGNAIVLVHAGKCHSRSDAVLRILRLLPGAWSLLGGLRLVPGPIRDWVYNVVSRNRYRLFGRRNFCRMSLDGFEDRFLE